MNTIGYGLAGLTAAGIIFIGARFLLSPTAAARDYGIPDAPAGSPSLRGWLAVKGTRDIVSGLFVGLLMIAGPQRLLGAFMLVAALIPIGDAAIVLRSGGSRAAAFGIHGVTALVIIAAGACLIAGSRA